MKSNELDYSLEKVCKLKDQFTSWLEIETSKGVEALDTKEVGEVADIIKDLAETERNCREACYYKTVTEAMKERGDDEMDRRGYSYSVNVPNRYMPSRTVSMGYRPYVDQEPYIDQYLNDDDYSHRTRMGYHENPSMSSRHGRVYDGYRSAKRYYTETKSMNDKMEMEKYSKEYLGDVIDALKEMWADAEPSHRQKMKEDLSKFVSSLTV